MTGRVRKYFTSSIFVYFKTNLEEFKEFLNSFKSIDMYEGQNEVMLVLHSDDGGKQLWGIEREDGSKRIFDKFIEEVNAGNVKVNIQPVK